jgi:hypothetical protein
MPSNKVKPQSLQRVFCAGFVMTVLLIPAAYAADEDQQAFCKYVTEEATAQRDLLLAPNAVAGATQPNTGLPTQLVWGLSGSLSNMRKAGLTMEAARKNCELYGATASAQQVIQYALSNIEKQALQNRLGLIQRASERLEALVTATTKMLEAQNVTRPMAFALQTTKIKLEADRADTKSKMGAIYSPQLSDKPVKELIAEKQRGEANERQALNKLNRQNDWDVSLAVGAHQQINPLAGNQGAYGEVTVSYNLASHAINRHLDQSANAYDEWKKVQAGDIMRNAEVLRGQVLNGIGAQDDRLQALLEEQKQIESNLQLLGAAETTAAVDFRNQLSTAQLLLEVEIGDASFRLDQLKEFLGRNF